MKFSELKFQEQSFDCIDFDSLELYEYFIYGRYANSPIFQKIADDHFINLFNKEKIKIREDNMFGLCRIDLSRIVYKRRYISEGGN